MAKKTNCTKNGKNYYRITRVVGHKADGTPIRKEFYGSGINEANEKADEYMNKLKNGFTTDFEKVSVAELMKKWLFTVKIIAVRPPTFVKYEGDYRLYVEKSTIASLKVCNVKKIHIQEFYNNLFEKENKTTQKINSIHKLLHSFFEYAVDEGYLIKNPCNKVAIPKNMLVKSEDKKIACFTTKEINDIKTAFIGNKFETLIYTAIYTGMRRGELCALKWQNVNLDDGYIHVDESIKFSTVFTSAEEKSSKVLILDPKTHNSIRDIYIPEILIKKLKEHKKNSNSEYVFTNNGNLITPKALYTQWKNVLKENNIPYQKFHALRHTYASTLLANGADLKSVQDLMGHYDISITQIYLHSLPENKKKIVNIFDNL